ncbi:MAG: glycosyltransferase family 2 protein [Spirochaetaceae bacterium]|nr:MAG: glycosyltransferase family 2 protein [Spirochaetaceae bacterium]
MSKVVYPPWTVYRGSLVLMCVVLVTGEWRECCHVPPDMCILCSMPTLWLLVVLLTGFGAGTLIFGVRVVRKSTELLPPAVPDRTFTHSPALSVIIPARNEASRIATLLQSLSEQSLEPLEILVVDDESTDQTAQVAHDHGARVLSTPPRPHNWVGKPWACHTGASESAGELLLFLDADVELAPTALERIVAAREATGGVVSVQPYHRTVCLYESFSALFNAQVVTAVGVGPASRGLFGPCVLFERSAYYRCGGHEAVQDSVLDDVDLGKCCLQKGTALRNYLGGNAVLFRMYPGGPLEMHNGWTRNFLQGAGATPTRTLLLQSLWIIGAVTAAAQAALTLAGSALALLGGWLALGVYAAYAVLLALSVRTYGSFGAAVALTFPAHLLFFGSVMVRALWIRAGGGSVDWRGRTVQLHVPDAGETRIVE